MDRTSVAVQWALENRRDTSSFAGKIRKAMGILCESASVGKVFTSVIPNDLNLASAVCGGLNVVFSAMEQKAVHERSIRDAMEELPLILRTHEPFAEAATRDLRIHQETDALYVAVCQVLQHIIEWLIENSISMSFIARVLVRRTVLTLLQSLLSSTCSHQKDTQKNSVRQWQKFVVPPRDSMHAPLLLSFGLKRNPWTSNRGLCSCKSKSFSRRRTRAFI